MARKENLWHWMESGEMVVVKLGGWLVAEREKREREGTAEGGDSTVLY